MPLTGSWFAFGTDSLITVFYFYSCSLLTHLQTWPGSNMKDLSRAIMQNLLYWNLGKNQSLFFLLWFISLCIFHFSTQRYRWKKMKFMISVLLCLLFVNTSCILPDLCTSYSFVCQYRHNYIGLGSWIFIMLDYFK